MTKSWRHWCPNGCGKSVIWFYSRRSGIFHCEKCNKDIARSLEELKNLINKPLEAQI